MAKMNRLDMYIFIFYLLFIESYHCKIKAMYVVSTQFVHSFNTFLQTIETERNL